MTDAAFWAAATAYPEWHPGVPEALAVRDAFEQSDLARTDEEKTAALRAVLPAYFADFWGRRAEFEPLRAAVRSWRVSFDSTAIDYRTTLPAITARTVIVCGRHDFICGPVWAGMLHEGIAGSQVAMLANSGHFGQIEQPEEFLQAVLWLLEDRNARSAGFAEEIRATFRNGDDPGVTPDGAGRDRAGPGRRRAVRRDRGSVRAGPRLAARRRAGPGAGAGLLGPGRRRTVGRWASGGAAAARAGRGGPALRRPRRGATRPASR